MKLLIRPAQLGERQAVVEALDAADRCFARLWECLGNVNVPGRPATAIENEMLLLQGQLDRVRQCVREHLRLDLLEAARRPPQRQNGHLTVTG